MIPFRVKVCGITRPEDASVAINHGADMIGMIFSSESPRHVTPDAAADIIAALPPVIYRVGVFVDDPMEEILITGSRLGLDFLQLHGPYSDDDVRKAKKSGFRTIRLYHITKETDYKPIYTDPTDIVLVDNQSAVLPGGTGERFDWGIRPPSPIVNLMLAGGITADNVTEGVKIFRPLIVDVNSGVEEEPGIKSIEKLHNFFDIANKLRYAEIS